MNTISFGQFFADCKDRLTDAQLRVLNPEILYFKDGKSYFGVIQDERGVWIDIMVGDMAGIWALRRLVRQAGVERLGFLCRKPGPVYALAEYYRAEIEDSGQKYADGATAWRCIIKPLQTLRLTQKVESGL